MGFFGWRTRHRGIPIRPGHSDCPAVWRRPHDTACNTSTPRVPRTALGAQDVTDRVLWAWWRRRAGKQRSTCTAFPDWRRCKTLMTNGSWEMRWSRCGNWWTMMGLSFWRATMTRTGRWSPLDRTGRSGHGFAGEQFDGDTRFVYLRTRWLDPQIGQFGVLIHSPAWTRRPPPCIPTPLPQRSCQPR